MSAKDVAVSEEQKMIRAAGQIGLYTLLSRLTGLVRDIVIGSVFGAGFATDAFFVAFRVPNLLRRVVGEGAATAALVPVVTEYRTRRSQTETVEMIKAVTGVGAGILLGLTVAGTVWAEPLATLFAPGFSPAKLALTVTLLRVMFPFLFFIGLYAVAMGVLHAFRHFPAPAFAPALLNVVVIFAALFAFWFPSLTFQPVVNLAYGVILGGLCQLLWQIPALRLLGISVTPSWQPRHPAIRQVALLLGPVLVGTAVYQVSLLVNSLFASLLKEGSVSSLWYATRLFEFPQGIFIVALSSAALPSLAAQAQRMDLDRVSESLSFALRLVNCVTLPAAVGLGVLAVPISSVLFFHGAFVADQVIATAAALRGFAVGLWSVAVTRLLSSCLYALQDTRTPAYAGVIAFLANICFSLILMGEITVSADAPGLARFIASLNSVLAVWNFGSAGLALAASLSATVNLLLLGAMLSRRLERFPWRPWGSSLVWSLIASLVMTIPVWWVSRQIDWLDKEVPFLLQLSVFMLAIAVGAVSFLLVAWRGQRAELDALIGLLPQRLLRFLPQFLQSRQ